MIRVIDIETSGLDPAKDAIIEIASVDMVKGGGVTNRMQTFVALPPGKDISPESSAVHHIIAADLEGAPKFAEAITRFQGADVYVAHNSAFERGFFDAQQVIMGPTLHRSGESAPWLCTYKCALRVWPDFESHSNQSLRYRFGIVTPFGYARDAISVHRAGSDVVVTAAILEKLLAAAAWSDLVDWSKEPALYTKLHFGKHRGMRYDKCDGDYLGWLLRQKDMDEGVLHSARHWLALREVAA